MKTFTSVLVAGFAALAQAVQLTNSNFNVEAGQPFEITWSDASGPVTLNLKNGVSTDLKTVSVIASGQTGTSFTWTPSSSLPSDQYAIEIIDSTGTPNYSEQFSLATSVTASASVTSTVTAASTTVTSVVSTITSSASVTSASTSAESSSVSSAANSTSASTVSTSTRASTRTSSTSGSTTAPTTVPGGDAGRIGSPIALIGLTIAAMLYFQ